MVNPTILLSCALAALLVTAMVTDLHARRIPNWLNFSIALLAAPLWWVNDVPLWPDVAIQLAMGLGALVLLTLLLHIGQMGGGDVKMIAALALVFSPVDLLVAMIAMAAVGGMMTAVLLVHHRLKTPDAPFENPYGVAIALGGLLVLGEWYQLVPTVDILRVIFPLSMAMSGAALVFVIALRIRRRKQASRTIS